MIKKLILGSIIGLSFVVPLYAISAIVPVQERSVQEIVMYFADRYDVSSKELLAVMQCESSGKQLAIGDQGKAIGIFQFHQPTWDSMSKKMGEELDIYSYYDQAKLASWAFSVGYKSQWSCSRIVSVL